MKVDIERILQVEPGIRAKEIAKKLNVDRTDVNSLLYKHPEVFRVDGQYCWTLVKPAAIVVEFQGDCWLTSVLFEESLSLVGSPLDADAQHITFVIPRGCKILLETAARLLALSNQLVDSKKRVTIDFSNCSSTRSYFDRVGFFDSLHENAEVLPRRPKKSAAKRYRGNSCNVVEFGTVEPANEREDDLTSEDNNLTDSFVSKTDESYEGVATAIFSELIGNIKGHSETQIPGFAALQSYTGSSPHIQTVVSDSGLGIATTLKESLSVNYPDIYRRLSRSSDFDVALVIEALTKGQISRHGKGRGLGFEITAKKAMKFDVKLSARQETFSVQVTYKNGELVDVQVCEGLVRIKGTHICFDFMIDQSASSD